MSIKRLKQRYNESTDPAQKQRIARRIQFKGGQVPGLSGAPATSGGFRTRPQGGLMGRAPLKGNKLNTAKKAIQGQYKTNIATAQSDIALNRPGTEQNPYGSQTYSYDENGNLVKNSQLSDPMQQRFDAGQEREMELLRQQQAALGRYGSQGPLSFDGLPSLSNDFSADRQRVEGSIYDKFDRRMSDQFGREQEDLKQYLANRGIPMGSERYNKEMEELSRRQNDARLDAQSQAIQMGGAEQQGLFNMNLAGRQQGINERSYLFNQPLQQAQALQGMQQGVINPQFDPTYYSKLAPTNVQGTAFNYFNANQQANLARQQMDVSRANAGLSAATSRANNSASNAAAMQRLQAQLAAQREQANANRPNPWAGAASGFAGGIGQGIGAGLGGLF